MVKKIIIKTANWLKSPKVTLVIGIMLFISGIFEISETFVEKVVENFLGFEIGLEHGIIIFGFTQIFIALCHLFEGIENIGLVTQEKSLQEEIEEIKEQEEVIEEEKINVSNHKQ
jgi:uncharacterized membrane protein HdeD (DUF308 family)